MRKRLFESASIIGGTILSLVPYFKQGANMNLASWIMVGIGVSFILGGVIYGIFWHEKHLKLKDKNALVERRHDYLPRIKTIIHERLNIAEKLATEASKIPLTEYRDKYLKYTWQYKLSHLWFHHDEDQAIINALSLCHFITDNLYFASLKENNANLRQLMMQYKALCAEETDKNLNRLLNQLWRCEHWIYSNRIYALLSKNNPRIRNTPMGLRHARIGQDLGDNILSKQFEQVSSRINELLEGEDL